MKQLKIKKWHAAVLFLCAGTVSVIVAFSADALGISKPGFMGVKQIYCILLGVGLWVIGGILFLSPDQLKSALRNFISGYKIMAIIIFNIIFILLILESVFFVQKMQKIMTAGSTDSPVRNLEVALIHPAESDGGGVYQYYPYVAYRHAPYVSQRTNINEQGVRVTPGAQCTKEAYVVHVFGGSTVYGAYVADNETLPYYLQKELDASIERDVCVVNFGANGWVSTQGVIMLIQELQNNRIPDLVIFYDGHNDSFAAEILYVFGPNIQKMIEESEKSRRPTLKWIQSLRTYQEFERILEGFAKNKSIADTSISFDSSALGEKVVSRYLSNVKVVEGIAERYGFRAIFVWQPLPKEYIAKFVFLTEAYSKMRTMSSQEGVLWLGDLFLDGDLTIYTGDKVHLKAGANEAVAQEIIKELDRKKIVVR